MVVEANALVSCLCKADTPLRFDTELQVSESSRRVHAFVLLSAPRVDGLPASTVLCTFSDCAFARALHRLRCLVVDLSNRVDHGTDRVAPLEMVPSHTRGAPGRVLRQWHRSYRATPISVTACAVARCVMLEATNVTRHLRTLLAPSHALTSNTSKTGIHSSKAAMPVSTPSAAAFGQPGENTTPTELISARILYHPGGSADNEAIKAGSWLLV